MSTPTWGEKLWARLTLLPGNRGAKPLCEQHGGQLVCVRSCYNERRQKRLKTVELSAGGSARVGRANRGCAEYIGVAAFLSKVGQCCIYLQMLFQASNGMMHIRVYTWRVYICICRRSVYVYAGIYMYMPAGAVYQ